MPLSQTPGAIASRERRLAAKAAREAAELESATRAVTAASAALDEARRPIVYTTPPSQTPSAIRARERRFAARLERATYALSQAQARLERAMNTPGRAAPQAPMPNPVPNLVTLDDTIDGIHDLADRLVAAGRGNEQIQITVMRSIISSRGVWSEPIPTIHPRYARDLAARREPLKDTILYENEGTRIKSVSVISGASIVPERTFQIYLDGAETHCVIDPIIDLLKRKLEETTSERKIADIKASIKRATKARGDKWKNGVPESELQELAVLLRTRILIKTPCTADSKTQVYCPAGQPIAQIIFVHTRLHHLEPAQVTVDNRIHVPRWRLQEIFAELRQSVEYYEFSRYGDGVVWVRTDKGTYCLDNVHNDFVRDCERSWGLKSINSVTNKALSNYIAASVPNPSHYDVMKTEEFKRLTPCGFTIDGRDDYECFDMKAAFASGHTCDQFMGYPTGHIDRFSKTDREMGLGFYTIEDITMSPLAAEINAITGQFKNGMVVTSPELKYLRDKGCTYRITAGCWGPSTNINFSDPRWYQKEEGVPLYSRMIGNWSINVEAETFWIHGSQQYLKHIAAQADISSTIRFYEQWGEMSVTRPRESMHHKLAQVSYVKAYMCLGMAKQLEHMDRKQVIRLGCDCVYSTQLSAPKTGVFRTKEGELIKSNIASEQYINRPTNNIMPEAEFRDLKRFSVHLGPAGCGKTHTQLHDKGLINLMYVAPSYILAAAVSQKYGCPVTVLALLLANFMLREEIKRKYNWLYIDECGMLTRGVQEQIKELFPNMGIMFGGDMAQLGPYSENGEEVIRFDPSLCDQIVEYTENQRCKCTKLAEILARMRKATNDNAACAMTAMDSFQAISREDLVKMYNPRTDIILTHSNASKQRYTDMMDEAGKQKKWRVNKNIGEFFNGSIVFELTGPLNDKNTLMQHGFTVHCVQGVDMKKENGVRVFLDRSVIYRADLAYTAASRVEYWDQVYLIN